MLILRRTPNRPRITPAWGAGLANPDTTGAKTMEAQYVAIARGGVMRQRDAVGLELEKALHVELTGGVGDSLLCR